MLAACAAQIDALHDKTIRLIAVDGPDAVGKTRFARDLVDALVAGGESAVSASVDGFHNPKQIRHRRADSEPARSFYEDSFDYDQFEQRLLEPVRAGVPAEVTLSVFDVRTDDSNIVTAELGPGAIVVVDGIFLQRPRLAHWWDLVIYLDAPDDVTMARGIDRDAAALHGTDAAEQRYAERYVPGQELYRAEADPVTHADVVIDMTDPSSPTIVRGV